MTLTERMKTMEVGKILVLLLCHIIFLSKAIVLPNFYPFGVSDGDRLVPTNDDGSSGTISISIQFPFYDRNHNSLFVNTNGVISFLVQVSQYTPDPFPLGDSRRLVAPFWADVDTRNGGQVFYRETTDTQLLKRATNDVTATFVDHRKFKATWLFVATWYEVAFYGAGNFSPKRNTFQAILITNGRHSFVIYNYNNITWTTGTASSGDHSGLGGTQAQAGFNAGDGKNFYTIQGSGTHDVINLFKTSNVARPGRWIFRIDNARIEEAGCNTKGSIVISPGYAIMLGGDNLFVSGPCFNSSDEIICKFSGDKATNGSHISPIQASCTVPMLYLTGRLTMKMSINGGRSFDYQGIITIVNIVKFKPAVVRHMAKKWSEQSQVRITWDPANLGGENQRVTVQLARFSMKSDRQVAFHSTFNVVAGQENDGTSQFVVPKGVGQGATAGDDRFVTLVLVKRIAGNFGNSPAEWIWSDPFHWLNYEIAKQRCVHWYNRQPDPKTYTDDISLLSCPQTFLQAMADRGRFMLDEYCHQDAEQHCTLYRKEATHCFSTNNPSEQGAGQQCCYNEQGNLMIGPKNGGSLNRVHIGAGVPFLSHFFHDLMPYSDCCVLSENCGKYFEKRPSDNGMNYEPPRPATGVGEPHMITLDGVEYTFNGYGEYQILQVAPSGFQLQGRMQPLINRYGRKTLGTVYKAFAMKENGSDIVQVHINGRDEVDVLVNGALMEFDERLLMDFNGVTVLKYNNSYKYSTIFNSGISVTIEKADELLQMMLLVPQMYKGNTSGLLGFWDGDQVKEYLLPNGTFLDTNSNQSRIHYEFGQKWAVTEEDSLFTYDYGENQTSYVDVEYIPVFFDQELIFDDVIFGQKARNVCGNNKQCLFDIYTTGKISIGMNSKKAWESFVAVVNEIETPGCIPMENVLRNGLMQRKDSKDGAMLFKFHCDTGFSLTGPSVIRCYQGQWNGSRPSCEPSGTKRSWKLWYVLASAIAGIVLIAVVIVVFCCIRRRCNNSDASEVREASQIGQKINVDLTYNNPAYVSCSDLKSA